MGSIIIGTAGHIDHGKSALVRALTGTDPDRLAEEQERGMTIDLGFAFLSESIAFIDVPGHERFVKNMVAGVHALDFAMLVVAADDGVMPQTREHLDILSLLQVKNGLVAINKIDLVDDELLALVKEELKAILKDTFLASAPIFEVSAATGQGLAELRTYLLSLPDQAKPRHDRGFFWMPVDRSFSMKGFGTVVTGSVVSGRTAAGDTLELLPAARPVKVRGLQSHGHPVAETCWGERAAINLQNISREEIQRGDVLATPGQFQPTQRLDVRLTLLTTAARNLEQRTRVRVHLGTREVLGRVKLLDRAPLLPGRTTYSQLILEQPVAALRRDAFVIRQYSPPLTIGGGIILETGAKPHRMRDAAVLQQLAGLEKENPAEQLLHCLLSHADQIASLQNLKQWSGLTDANLRSSLDRLLADQAVYSTRSGDAAGYVAAEVLNAIKTKIVQSLTNFHEKEPLRPGMNKAELKIAGGAASAAKIFEWALKELAADGKIEEQPGWVRLSGFQIHLSAADEQTAAAILAELGIQPFAPPDEKELADRLLKPVGEIRRILGALQGMDRVLHLENDLFFVREAITEIEKRLIAWGKHHSEISVSQFRELLATSRKYAVPLLGFFDQQGLTERSGDVRLLHPETSSQAESDG